MKNQLLKISAITLVVCGIMGTSQAQSSNRVWSFGPELGVNFAKYGMDSDETDYNSGLIAGGFITYSVENVYGITGKILFSQKGAKYKINNTEIREHLNYIEIPVMARYFFNREGTVRPNIFAGPSFGFLNDAKIKIGDGEYQDIEDGDGNGDYKDVYNTFDFGLGLGLGLNVKVAQEMYFIIDTRYTYGLTDVSKSSDDTNNQTLAITAGLSFGLGN